MKAASFYFMLSRWENPMNYTDNTTGIRIGMLDKRSQRLPLYFSFAPFLSLCSLGLPVDLIWNQEQHAFQCESQNHNVQILVAQCIYLDVVSPIDCTVGHSPAIS